MRRRATLTALGRLAVLALAPAVARAEAYKCTDAAGRTTYSDRPCPPGPGTTASEVRTAGDDFVTGTARAPGSRVLRLTDGLAAWATPGRHLDVLATATALTAEDRAAATSRLQEVVARHAAAGYLRLAIDLEPPARTRGSVSALAITLSPLPPTRKAPTRIAVPAAFVARYLPEFRLSAAGGAEHVALHLVRPVASLDISLWLHLPVL